MMKVKSQLRDPLGRVVTRFLSQMHRFDAGRTLPLLYESEITTPQLAVLEFTTEPRTISALSEHLGLSLPATSQMVQKLVERGLICRSEGVVDRREKRVVLAAPGETLLGAIAAARAARFEASLASLLPPVAARLESALREASDALEHAALEPSAAQSRRTRS